MFTSVFLQLSFLAALCSTVFYFYFRRNYGYWKKRGVLYEKPTVLVGNLGHLMRISTWDFLHALARKHKTRDYVGIFLGQEPALVINSIELAKKILVKDFGHFQNRYTYSGDKGDPLGALNLFSIKNPLWSVMKQELAPLFTTLRLKTLTELMNTNSVELVQRIQTDYVENRKPVNLKELFSMYTSDIIGYTVFGLKVSALRDLTSPLWAMTCHMVKWTFWRGFEITMIFLVPDVAKIMRLKFFSAQATAYIRQLFWSVVEQRKKVSQPDTKDLLNHLMKLKENFKLPINSETKSADDLILAQAAVFIIGSIETSTSTLSFCLHELSYHPEEQEKLYKEISTAFKEKGNGVLEYNDLLELKFLSACIKETLRKHSPGSYLDRVCNSTYNLTDELTIDPGIPIMINLTAIHYNEEIYPNPEQWQPDRFVGSSENDNRNFSFLPFGEGPRACIGKRYANMQLRTAIAHMVMKYRFEPAEPYLIKSDPYSISLTPISGGKVKFVPR